MNSNGPLGHLSHLSVLRRLITAITLCVATPWAQAQMSPSLPPEVVNVLQRGQVPAESMVVFVQEVGQTTPVLSWQAQKQVNPASVIKLLTTYAALDLMGPVWAWSTPVWVQGLAPGNPDSNGVFNGNLVIKGQGDPKLVMERLWLLMRRVHQLGIREIRGDIILDRSAFSAPEQNPGDFDGEPLKPYNVGPDALLLNYKSLLMTFTPDPARNVAIVSIDPPLADLRADTSVPLSAGPCNDWRSGLKADLSQPLRLRFNGSFPASCGELRWPIASADPGSYNHRAILGMWQHLGGRLTGQIRDGLAPAVPPTFELTSPNLSEVVRDINKYSNNVMAQQLFLTLGLKQRGEGSPERAREVLRDWLKDRLGETREDWVIDNGSGLSRRTRVSAELIGKLLQSAWSSPVMSELMSSLPVGGLETTLKRLKANPGRTHLKTGSLDGVAGVAGYVLSPSGRRYVLVAIINHPNASAGRPAIDTLVDWVANSNAVRKAGASN